MFELRRDSPLFDQKLNLLCISTSQEDFDQEISLKILTGTKQLQNNQKENILYFEITDENNLYFLYTLEIGEQDYHNLKKDQRLVTDFTGFSKRFIDLINLCMKNYEENNFPNSQFVAKMDFNTSVFSIVEINEFNHVIRLCLQFRPGTDASIKSYLASNLQLSLTRYAILQEEYQNLNQECITLKRLNREQATDLRTIRDTTDREIHSIATTHSQELNLLQHQHLEKLETSRNKWQEEMNELKINSENQIKELQSKLSSLEFNYNNLLKEKNELDLNYRQSNTELEKLQQECIFYKNSTQEYQELVRTNDKERYQLEQELARTIAKKEALELQVSDKEEIVQKSTSLRNASEQSRQEALKQIEMYTTALSNLQEKLKTAVSEINKGNETIRKLQNDNSTIKEKLNSKNEIIRKQEMIIDEQKERFNELQRKFLLSEDSQKILNQKKEILEREITEFKKQLTVSATRIEENEQTIKQLHELLTEFQLGGTGKYYNPSHTSPNRYSSNELILDGYNSTSQQQLQLHSSPVITPATHKYNLPEQNQQNYHLHSYDYTQNTTHEDLYTSTNQLNNVSKNVSRTPNTNSNININNTNIKTTQFQSNIDYSSNEKKLNKKDVQFDPLLTSTSVNNPPTTNSIGLKGYYDGLIDIPVVSSTTSSSRPVGITPSKSPHKKPVYAWTLPEFGTENEEKIVGKYS